MNLNMAVEAMKKPRHKVMPSLAEYADHQIITSIGLRNLAGDNQACGRVSDQRLHPNMSSFH